MLCSSVNQPEQVNKFMFLTQQRWWQLREKYEWKVLFHPLCPSGVWKGLIYGSAVGVCEAMLIFCVCVCVLSATIPDSSASSTLFWPFNPNKQAQQWWMTVRLQYKSNQKLQKTREQYTLTHTQTPGLSGVYITSLLLQLSTATQTLITALCYFFFITASLVMPRAPETAPVTAKPDVWLKSTMNDLPSWFDPTSGGREIPSTPIFPFNALNGLMLSPE